MLLSKEQLSSVMAKHSEWKNRSIPTHSSQLQPFSFMAETGLKTPQKSEHIRSIGAKSAGNRSISVHFRSCFSHICVKDNN